MLQRRHAAVGGMWDLASLCYVVYMQNVSCERGEGFLGYPHEVGVLVLDGHQHGCSV